MSTFLITQTPFSKVRPIDPSVRLTGERLRNVLRRHLEADELDEACRFFADPEPVSGVAATDWYTDYEGDGQCVGQIGAAEKENALSEVGRLCARIAQIADQIEADQPGSSDAAFLRAAIAVPDNNHYIYVFDGKPVIVAWGHKMAGSGQVPVPAGIWVKAAAPEVSDPLTSENRQDVAEPKPTAEMLTTGGVAGRGGIGWLAWLLWALFLVLFLIVLWITLSACSIGLPQSTLAQRIGLLHRCPAPAQIVQRPVTQEADRAAVLRQAIREAELALAEDAQSCRVDRRREDEARRAALSPPATPEPDDPGPSISDEADDRVREAGGQTGEMQIVLQWDGPADLDMSVSCGGSGRISYSNREACNGGELDVDANYEIHMDRPVENIHWAESPPPGTYELRVRNHSRRGDPRPNVPFTILVRQGDDERTYQGRVAEGREVSVTDIVVE